MPGEMAGRRILGRITSINVRKAVWAADELGLAYEREDWGLPLRDPNVPEFLSLNPNALVPVLVEGDFVLWESHPIMRYFAESAPEGGLIPADPRQRALMEQWLAWLQTELGPAWLYAYLALGRKTPGHDDQAQIVRSIERWSKRMAILDAHLADGRPYMVGEDFTLADIAIGLGVHRWMFTPFDKPALSFVGPYYERLKGRAAGAPYLTDKTP